MESHTEADTDTEADTEGLLKLLKANSGRGRSEVNCDVNKMLTL